MNLPGPRVILRQWNDADLEPFAAMNADPEVMEFFPNPSTMEQSLASLARLKRGIDERGWGLWAVEIEQEFAGFTGLADPNLEAHFTPCVEIGWRFHRRFWGRGYALEAAQVALRFAFETLRLQEVVSFTAQLNERSQRLMQRLGLTHSALDDFEHPMLPAGHPLRHHVLYRIQNTPALLERLNQDLAERDGQSKRRTASQLEPT
jgi:RimJ/RimL family protein N-acetyltransferase